MCHVLLWDSTYIMLWWAILRCNVLRSCVISSYAMLSYDMLGHMAAWYFQVTTCCSMLYGGIFMFLFPTYIMFNRVIPHCAMMCHVILCYKSKHFVILCYTLLLCSIMCYCVTVQECRAWKWSITGGRKPNEASQTGVERPATSSPLPFSIPPLQLPRRREGNLGSGSNLSYHDKDI